LGYTSAIEEPLNREKLVLLSVILTVLGFASGCGKSEKSSTPNQPGTSSPSGPTKVNGQPTTTPSGLEYWDIVVGTGATAVPGKPVSVHYTGWLTNGDKFDSSLDRGKPFVFPLGEGQVIKGWDEGVAGMKAGGKRQLKIPPALGYGDSGAGGVIPPKATLIFDVELLEVGK
jgi:FKBP-type peptidyl-prolyl cis-trans isomerase